MSDRILSLAGNVAFWLGGPVFVVMLLRYAVTGWLIGAGILAAEIVRSLWVLTMLERRPTRITSPWRLAFHLGMTTAAFVVLEWVCTSGLREAYISGMQVPTIDHLVSGVMIAAIHLPPCFVGVMGLTRVWRLREWDRWRPALVTAVATVLLMAVIHAAIAWMVLPTAVCQLLLRMVATESR